MTVLAVAPAQGPESEFHHDFRGAQGPLPALQLFGPNAGRLLKPESAGLRITIPANRKKPLPVGVSPPFSLAGDFEITLDYEILAADRPEKGYGVGVNIWLMVGSPMSKAATLGRYLRPSEGEVHFINVTTMGDEKKAKHQIRTVPAKAKSGLLCLRRTGSVLHFLAADGRGGELRPLHEAQFSADEVRTVRFAANTGDSPAGLEVRFRDVRIRATHLPNPGAEGGQGTWSTWLIVCVGTGLAVLAAAYLTIRYRGMPLKSAAPLPKVNSHPVPRQRA